MPAGGKSWGYLQAYDLWQNVVDTRRKFYNEIRKLIGVLDYLPRLILEEIFIHRIKWHCISAARWGANESLEVKFVVLAQ